MSGIYARSKYDALFQEELTTQTVRSNYYAINDDSWNNNKRCVSYNGPRSNRTGNIGEIDTGDRVLRVDVESKLARDYSDTKYMSGNTLEEKRKILLAQVEDFKPKHEECNSSLELGNSRLETDKKNFREQAYNVIYDNIIDPREWVFYGNNDNGVDTTGNNRFGRSSRYDNKITIQQTMDSIKKAVDLRS
jgi:hypothetical protein